MYVTIVDAGEEKEPGMPGPILVMDVPGYAAGYLLSPQPQGSWAITAGKVYWVEPGPQLREGEDRGAWPTLYAALAAVQDWIRLAQAEEEE
jgi:hypothetical protein